MRIQDTFLIAWKGLRHAGMRSVLTMLGIIIGIASVIILMSIGRSSQNYILSQVEGIGSNLIFVIPSVATKGSFSAPSSLYGVIIKTMKDRDVAALEREPSVDKVGVATLGQGRAVFGDQDIAIAYAGVNYDYTEAINLPTERGVWFNDNDVASLAHVAVIGPKLADDLFGSQDPIGKNVRLKGLSFQVIGIIASKGALFGSDIDNMLFIPVSVANKQIQGVDYYSRMVVKGRSEYSVDFIKERIASVLRADHGITDPNKDDFMISTQEEVVSLLGNITSIMSLFLTAIAAISLVVGGIGIMNIMLVSVVERTKEIGLRKAVGASNGAVLAQFLFESVMLTAVGGVAGIVLGGLVSFGIAVAIKTLAGIPEWSFVLPLDSVLLAVLVSTAIGLVFGIYPARQAARKNPIEALHYE